MFFRSFTGRAFGISTCVVLTLCCSQLHAGTASSFKHPEVEIQYKAKGLTEFHLADYKEELLQCSALAAIHMWISDNIGQDSGSEVRRTIYEAYWLEISNEYLSLAKKASDNADLSQEVRAEIRNLTGEWRRLTETKVGAADWASWYELVDRCDTWRPEKATRAYFSNGS